MKKLFAGFTLISLIVPTLALAHDTGLEEHAKLEVYQHNQTNLDFLPIQAQVGIDARANASLNANASDDDEESNDDSDERGNATSSSRNRGQQGDDSREQHASTSAKDDDHPLWGSKGGLVSFLRWLFGLPATTTVGEIRADIAATTTASTTESKSQGLGFWARILSVFNFGN